MTHDPDVAALAGSLSSTVASRLRGCEERAYSGEPDVPNEAEGYGDCSAILGFFQNVSETGQVMEMSRDILDMMGRNRAIAEYERTPGEYFDSYRATLSSDERGAARSAERVLAAAAEAKRTKLDAEWHVGTPLHRQMGEFIETLRQEREMA
jgi:hypothetical protein